jgi:transposase
VVRQELLREHDVDVSLRTVERAVKEQRRRLRAVNLGTVRFETAPGRQLQADFGEIRVKIAGEAVKVHLCVLTLGYSRRVYVRAYRNEKQENWLSCMEDAFRAFGGVPEEVLVDNARALVTKHNVETGEVQFSSRFADFARYWGFRPKACAPYRPRTKGKDERGVQYVKRNAIAGREFASWEALDGWLAEWSRDVADARVHGTTGEKPAERFERDEAHKLKALHSRPPFVAEREYDRKVHTDATVEVGTNWYTVPWTLIGCWVTVRVRDQALTVHYGEKEVAAHVLAEGRRVRVVDEGHWSGLRRGPSEASFDEEPPSRPAEFERSLAVYEEAAAIDSTGCAA